MSYEHCEKHDMEATNGCPKCHAERIADAKQLLSDVAKAYARDLELLSAARAYVGAADDGRDLVIPDGSAAPPAGSMLGGTELWHGKPHHVMRLSKTGAVGSDENQGQKPALSKSTDSDKSRCKHALRGAPRLVLRPTVPRGRLLVEQLDHLAELVTDLVDIVNDIQRGEDEIAGGRLLKLGRRLVQFRNDNLPKGDQ